ncbi:protein kinase domain-containing protein [Actinomadura madurae]|uniref:protein kinase domain-containing protein n=1 Tax=Actinomadura madurae TaxID=1993 RepID=UPI000D8EEB4D|nr:protein kinase [Actinomadura madurae]SPT56702.1 Serine/threonine-protein kinase PrkC [Actinomadura madurae]
MEPGFRLEDRYRMEHRVGRRGPAQVWRAHDELLARGVAVTLVGVPHGRRRTRRRLRDAARAAAALTHPGIVTTYDYGEAEGSGGDALTYVVTEYLNGESLTARLARGLPGPQEAAGVCAQIADALAAVHACGVVHGDLRAGQVFLAAGGVKLLGLGVAGPAADAADEGAAEAPQGREGPDAEAGQAADVLALGAILAACLPETADGEPDGAVAELAELAARCRSADPAARPPAAEVARTLAAHAGETAVLPLPAGAADAAEAAGAGQRAPVRRRPGGARRAGVLGAAAAALALALVPLAVTMSALPDPAAGGVTLPVPPRPSAEGPSGSARDPGAPPGPPTRRASPAVPAADARTAAVGALTRLRRAIDVGIALGEVGPRFGSELATEVTTLLNEVDQGRPVDLGRRVARLRAALDGRTADEVSPARAAGLAALLAEVPVPPS